MELLANLVVGLSAASHLFFFYLEAFAWQKPLGMRIFRNNPDRAKITAPLAANQGLHNGFLAIGLAWSLVHPDPVFGRQIAFFFLGCVVVAGIVGAATASRRILYIQAMPAAIALALKLLAA